jgi:hypothetical protein
MAGHYRIIQTQSNSHKQAYNTGLYIYCISINLHRPDGLSENKVALTDLLAPEKMLIISTWKSSHFYFGTEIQYPLPVHISTEIIIIILQRIFAALCHNWSFQDVEYHYETILGKLNLQTLYVRSSSLRCPAFNNVFTGIKYCFSGLEPVGISVPTRTYVTLRCPAAPSPTALQLDVFLLLMQFVNAQIFLITPVCECNKP